MAVTANSTISGRVTSGLGQGAAFTRLDWARELFRSVLGIDPHPGTLNLIVDGTDDVETWRRLKATPGERLRSPRPAWCDARAYPVRIADRVPGAIVVPEVPGYPEDEVELIAGLSIRDHLSLSTGARLSVQICRPLEVSAVLFDVDGTLVDSLEAYRIAADKAAAPRGFDVTLDLVRDALNTERPFWDAVVPLGTSDRPAVIAALKERAARYWPEAVRAHSRVFPRLRETLEALRAVSLRTGIVTGSRIDVVQPLREAGVIEYFDAVVTGRDVARRKPDPEGLLRCLSMLGVGPGEAVYVGDTPLDVQASRAAGMASVAVLSGAGDCALLSASGPERLAESHEGLLRILGLS